MRNYILSFKLRYAMLGISIAFLIFYTIIFYQHKNITTLQAVYVMFIILLGTLPGLLSFFNKSKAKLIPLMPMHAFFYAVTFGAVLLLPNGFYVVDPIDFLGKEYWISKKSEFLSKALMLTIIGQICLYIGYYGLSNICKRIKTIQVRNVPPHQQIRFAWILFICFFILELFPSLRGLPSVNQLSTPLIYMSLGILFLLALDKKLTSWQLIFFFIAVVYTITNKLVSGSLTPLVLLFIFFGVLFWSNKRRMPLYLIILTVIIVLLLNPVKHEFRKNTWYSQDPSVSLNTKITLLGKVIKEHYLDKNIAKEVINDSTVTTRISHISLFAYTISATPQYIPHWHGDTYGTLWTSYIPRFLWPAKPQASIGQDFGHRYFLLQPYDKGTSINLPWLVEFYINFGILGVMAGMFIVGIFFRIVLEKLSVPVQARMEYVLAVTITFSLFNAESNFSLMVGGMLPTFIVFYVLIRLLTSESNKVLSKRPKFT